MNLGRKLYIYPHCHVIIGYERAIIFDSSKKLFQIIPLDFANTIRKNRFLLQKKKCINNHTVDTYASFLIKHNMGTYHPIDPLYESIKMNYDFPGYISNAILYTNQVNKRSIEELCDLGCDNIQLFSNKPLTFKEIISLLEFFNDTIFQNIELILSYGSEYFNTGCWQNIFDGQKRLQKVLVSKAPSNKRLYTDCLRVNYVQFIQEKVTFLDCGEIHPLRFICNLPFFTEAQHHNTCLNRKICINENGNIKNCPAMKKSYGNIRDTTLKEAIEKPCFKDCWTICKDQIDVCKDCEFRYMCTDCRAFIKDPENPYSQPAKCTYNPYICLWEGQAGYVPVEECGTYSRETGFVPDKDIIAELNRKIWNENEE